MTHTIAATGDGIELLLFQIGTPTMYIMTAWTHVDGEAADAASIAGACLLAGVQSVLIEDDRGGSGKWLVTIKEVMRFDFKGLPEVDWHTDGELKIYNNLAIDEGSERDISEVGEPNLEVGVKQP